MGSFAALGALSGAASGWNEGSKRAEEQKQHKLDQEREERLLQMQHDWKMERDKAGYSQEEKMAGIGQENTLEVRGVDNEFKTSEREAGQEFDAEQSRLDRESDVELEGMKQKDAKSKSRERFQKGRTPSQEKQTADGNWEVVPGVPTVYNPTNKVTYLQKEGVGWIPEGRTMNTVKFPKERKKWEKDLYDNPTAKNMASFERNFGYIPREVMGAHERYLDSNPEG